MTQLKKNPNRNLDPLYVIFEQHLFNFQDPTTDRKTFISMVVTEYLSYLRKNQVSVPPQMEGLVAEELGHQVNTMLVKKIYGCLTIGDFQKTVSPVLRKSASRRYSRIGSKAG
jgi:hypothetical protein